MKIYFVRHQAAGVISKYPFSEPPTDAQVDAVMRECFQSFGAVHPKDQEPYWVRVYEVDVLGPDDVPVVPERTLGVAGVSGVPELVVSGVATVTPKGGV